MARNGLGGFSDGDDGYDPAIVAAAVLRIRIRDPAVPGSNFFPSRIRIPDPNRLHPGSRILIKEFMYLNPNKSKKMVSKLWSGLFIPDPGSGCWLSPIPDPGSRGQKGTLSRIRIRNTGIRDWVPFWPLDPRPRAGPWSVKLTYHLPYNIVIERTSIWVTILPNGGIISSP